MPGRKLTRQRIVCYDRTRKRGLAIQYDLLLKNGEVIDPSAKLRGRRDIAFGNGVVAAVAENISAN